MGIRRRCSRPSCSRQAVATLTYNYGESVVIVGPLSPVAEPHAYDLCQVHDDRVSAPRGWEVVRIAIEPIDRHLAQADMEALAHATREDGTPVPSATSSSATLFDEDEELRGAVGAEGIRRGHLWALPTSADAGY